MSGRVRHSDRYGYYSLLLLCFMAGANCSGPAGRAWLPTAPTTPASGALTTTATPAADLEAPASTPSAPGSAVGTVHTFSIEPARLQGGATAVGTVVLAAAAPEGGTLITLTSSDRDVRPPASITIPAGSTMGMFQIPTSEPHADTDVRLTANTAGGSATADLVLTLPAPGARGDSYTVGAGATLRVAAPGILDNDARRNGHDLWAQLVAAPMNGTLSLNADGGFAYRPAAGFTGSDRFIYRAMDGVTGSNNAHVWIEVTGAVPPGPSAPTPPTGSQTFSFTGGAQNFVVPAGVTQITVEAFGAEGGVGLVVGGFTAGTSGLGGSVQATIAVTPGETYQVNVGGRGANGAFGVGGGGGGGGASDIRNGALALADRLVVAGGGGGGGTSSSLSGNGGDGGAGGGLTAGTGGASGGGATGGSGGSQAAGGVGGPGGATGAAGALGNGGTGASSGTGPAGGFNGGAAGASAGGGGGGYFGGGGGGLANAGAGGGGGSSFATAGATSVTHQQGVRSGNGQIIIRW